MSQQTREALKLKFLNGLKPNQTDFENWLDSFVHQADPLDTVVPRATDVEAAAGVDNNKVITPFTLVATINTLVRLATLGDLLADVQSEINTAVAALVDSSPGTLDTLNELAAALGDDPNFATTIIGTINTAVSGVVDGAPSTLDTLNKLAAAIGNDANYATTVTHQISSAVAALVNASPTALDTLNELAAALGDDPNFATTMIGTINSAVSGLIDGAPAHLDTLNKLAAALGNDPNFATTITALIGTKLTQNGAMVGGSVDNSPIGVTTPATGKFTTLKSTDLAGESGNRLVTTDINGNLGKLTEIDGAYRINGGLDFPTTLMDGYRIGSVGALTDSPAFPAIVALGLGRIVHVAEFNNHLRVYDFDGADWTLIGNPFSLGNSSTISKPSIAALSSSRIALADNNSDSIKFYDFDGTDWAQVGNTLSLGSVSNSSMTGLTSTRFAFTDQSSNHLRVYQFDGVNCVQVGNSFNAGEFLSDPSVTALSSSRIAYVDSASGLRTYEFNGTDWAIVGNFLAASWGEGAITALSNSRIVLANGGNLYPYLFNGLSWMEEHTQVMTGSFNNPALAAISSSRVVLAQSGSQLKAYQWHVAPYVGPPSPAF